MKIGYQIGDATQPVGDGPKIIAHICNDVGGWGKGFVLAISRRWPQPEQRYRAWHRGEESLPFALGQVQFVQVDELLWIGNLIGQQGITIRDGVPPIRYEAVREGLGRIASKAKALGASVHMPRIGCGLAGGKWEEIEPLIEQELVGKGISVCVYDFAK